MTDWEQRYQDGDTPWDKGSAAPPLVELLEKKGPELFGDGWVMVPGCGVGHDVRELSGAGLTVLGVDVASSAIKRAHDYPRAMAEAYELGDILDVRWRNGREGQFSGWWEHTCFCAIDPSMRDAYAQAAGELLTEGGVLAGVFFLNPHDLGEEQDGPPYGATVDEIQSRFSAWFEFLEGWVPGSAYPGREGREWIGIFRRLPNP